MTTVTGLRSIAPLLLLAGLAACGTRPGERAGGGAAIGAGTGAAVGALAGGVGAIPGAIVGGAVGAGAGGLTTPNQVNLGKPLWERNTGQAQTAEGQSQPQAANLSPDEVRRLQEALRERGFDPGPVDGVFGPRTQVALRDYQRSQGLPATGEPDRTTLLAMGVTGQPGSNPQQQAATTQSAAAPSSHALQYGPNVDLRALDMASISLPDAIARATSGISGGRAIDAALGEQGGTPVYNVKVYDAATQAVQQRTVDARSGQVTGGASTAAMNQAGQPDAAALNALSTARLRLADAAKTAEQQASGRAVEARTVWANGRPAYEVTVAKSGSTQSYRIDPQSGQVTSG